ncbi:thermonuclease family protein [Synechococcus sp. AH-551-E02]|nr:thermonuclease family protein [Synechococcus sp. AH-551-E02]MDB4653629.1 thermonuclease family protein [Synechococcus sp. AH-551-E02]
MAITALAAPPVIAHGGGLDSQGCHTNSKTGDRHCHRSGASSTRPSSGLVSGSVNLVSVGDGDTVRVTSRSGEKVTIRLACIDAPETSQGASGKWSTQTLKGLVNGKSLSLKPQVKDRYGRTVAEIYVGNRNINLQMVQEGAAYAYRQYLKQCDREAYLQAETAASKKGLGVWGAYKPDQMPWEFRRSRRR